MRAWGDKRYDTKVGSLVQVYVSTHACDLEGQIKIRFPCNECVTVIGFQKGPAGDWWATVLSPSVGCVLTKDDDLELIE